MINKSISFNSKHPALVHLTDNDHRLHNLIKLIGTYTLELRLDYFSSLTNSVIGQQLSSKAANTIRNRLTNLCNGKLTPETIHALTDEEIKITGVSSQKTKYIRGLVTTILNRDLELDCLIKLNDEQVISSITQLKGFGVWTAKMFLIFSLGRLDVLAENDIGLQRAASWLYGQPINEKALKVISNSWIPYRSVASLYLWEIINKDYISKPCPF